MGIGCPGELDLPPTAIGADTGDLSRLGGAQHAQHRVRGTGTSSDVQIRGSCRRRLLKLRGRRRSNRWYHLGGRYRRLCRLLLRLRDAEECLGGGTSLRHLGSDRRQSLGFPAWPGWQNEAGGKAPLGAGVEAGNRVAGEFGSVRSPQVDHDHTAWVPAFTVYENRGAWRAGGRIQRDSWCRTTWRWRQSLRRAFQ